MADPKVKAVGKIYVTTEPGESLSSNDSVTNKVFLDNGSRVQVKRAKTTSVISASTTDSAFITAPAAATHYIVVLSLTVSCSATTIVTLNTKGAGAGTAISAPMSYATGVTVRPPVAYGIARALAGEAVTITTGAGGNTTVEAHYIEVPNSVDIL